MAKTYNPALDGIRGLAILGVLCVHAASIYPDSGPAHLIKYPLVFGWSGVDLFFVLSGFLITGILLETRQAANRVSSFYMRRFLRIFPLYYLALFIGIAVAALNPKLMSLAGLHSWPNRLAFIFYLQNWLSLEKIDPLLDSAVGHFWSLAIEEQFYLVWPWLVWALPPKAVLRLTLAGIAGAFLLRVLLVSTFGPRFWIHTLTFTRGEGLLVGSAIAIVSAQRVIPKASLSIMAAGGSAVLLFIAFGDPREFINTNAGPYMYTVGVSGLNLIFGALVGSSAHVVYGLTAFLNLGWLKSLGKYSYGIYVYHVPVYFGLESIPKRFGVRYPLPFAYSIALTAVLFAASFAVAWLSFTFFESRFLRMKSQFKPLVGLREPENIELSGITNRLTSTGKTGTFAEGTSGSSTNRR